MKKKKHIFNRYMVILFLCFMVFIIGCIQVLQLSQIDDTKIRTEDDFQQGLWVRAASMATPDAIDRIIARCLDMGTTDLYAQVVVGGYAYYRSQYLPRSQYLVEKSEPGYDPLSSLIHEAKKYGIRIHAWVNCLLVWSLQSPPDSTRHVYYQHPGWFIRDVTGKSMVTYTYEEWMDAGLEGLYLDPAHPGVQNFLQTVCTEIAANYPVNGIHLDFIRYPGTLWGLPDNDTASLFAGPEGHTTRWLALTRYPQLDFISRWLCWHAWQFNLEKEKNVKKIIQRIHASLSENAPDCILTTALFPNPSLARYRFAQNWMDWDTLIHYPIAMSYTPDRFFFTKLLEYILIQRPDAHFGIGILWPNMAAIGFMQATTARTYGARGVCYFDFTRIDTLSDYAKLKGIGIQPEDTLIIDTLTVTQTVSLFEDAPPEKLVLQGIHEIPPEQVLAFSEYLLSLSLDRKQDLAPMEVTVEEFVQYIQRDVAAFLVLDQMLFPLPETLLTPPRRTIKYTHIPWDESDTTVTVARAQTVQFLEHETTAYPGPILPLARAAYDALLNDRDLCRARSGIYVFSVLDISDKEQQILRQGIADTILPFMVNWTALQRAGKIIQE
jgi:uncharacterized lipoprotein YddW (UPF0748 family)